jgi:hypothetical protein
MDILEIVRAADHFRQTLEEAKARIGPVDFAWYPYDSLSNFWHLSKVLTGQRRRLLRLAHGRPVLDVGPGDGACSFFPEALGLTAHALENPATSHNGLRGQRAVCIQRLGGAGGGGIRWRRTCRINRRRPSLGWPAT